MLACLVLFRPPGLDHHLVPSMDDASHRSFGLVAVALLLLDLIGARLRGFGGLLLVAGLVFFFGAEANELARLDVQGEPVVLRPGLSFTLVYMLSWLGVTGVFALLGRAWSAYGVGRGPWMVAALVALTEGPARVGLAATLAGEGRAPLLLGLSFAEIVALGVVALVLAFRDRPTPFTAGPLTVSHRIELLAAAVVFPYALGLLTRSALSISLFVSAAGAMVAAGLLVALAWGRRSRFGPGYLVVAIVSLGLWASAVDIALARHHLDLQAFLPRAWTVSGPTATFELVGDALAGPEDGPAIVRRVRKAGGDAQILETTGKRLRLSVTAADPARTLARALERHTVALLGEVPDVVDFGAARAAGIFRGRRGEAWDLSGTRGELEAFFGQHPLPRYTRLLLHCPEPPSCTAVVVARRPIVSAQDVVDAFVASHPDLGTYSVTIQLSEAASAHFEAETRRLKGYRIAILVDDRVDSLPLVQSAIPGGRLQIAMAALERPAAQREVAERLAAALGAPPLKTHWRIAPD